MPAASWPAARVLTQVKLGGCAFLKAVDLTRLGGEVALTPGVVKEEEAALVVLIRRHCCAVGAAVRRAVDDEVPGAVGAGNGRCQCCVLSCP